MASVESLLNRARREGWLLVQGGQADNPDAEAEYSRGWVRLAYQADRVLEALSLDHPSRRLLEAVMDATEVSEGPSQPNLVGMGVTFGALADLLEGHRDQVDDAGVAARARVGTSVMAGVHAAAWKTVRVALWRDDPSTYDTMRDLADLTEQAAMISPDQLHSVLDWVAIAPSSVGTVDAAIARWQEAASAGLSSPGRVTEHSLRWAASDITLVCRLAASVLTQASESRAVDRGLVGDATALLGAAASAWHDASRWPEHLRMGGARDSEARQASKSMIEALRSPQLLDLPIAAQLTAVRSSVAAAREVGRYHEAAISRLVATGGLWVRTSELPEPYLAQFPGLRAQPWAPKPPGSDYGREVADGARCANGKLNAAWVEMSRLPKVSNVGAPPTYWESVESGGSVRPELARPTRDVPSPGIGR